MSVIYLEEWLKKRAETSILKSQSKPNIAPANHGQIPIDQAFLSNATEEILDILAMHMVLDIANRTPFTCKSKFARQNAEWIAVCASEGFLTTKVSAEKWGNRWRTTNNGKQLLEELQDDITEFLNE